MNKIKLDIVGLSFSQTQSGAYALVLGEVGGQRRLPIIIGGSEAQAIAVEMEKVPLSRPLTHDLFKTFANTFQIAITEVIIYNLVDGVFYAKLLCSNGNRKVEIDARSSDAIALAIRFGCPIYTYEFILASAGIVIDSNDYAFLENIQTSTSTSETKQTASKRDFSDLSDDALMEMLQKALEDEAYEKAAQIRDEISRRKSS
ncbi:bifunctional nuclease family protein [Olivibacter sitiensis]|uniref:bifunctional nuclease family protein n=1 Tax=Olivibacter sitiensis TaxID=376470 RepID=UPI00042634AF|nr:bifunctional nuclease family protein [Olivibacter sitiensis]